MKNFSVRTYVNFVEAETHEEAAKLVDKTIRNRGRAAWDYDVIQRGSGRSTRITVIEDEEGEA